MDIHYRKLYKELLKRYTFQFKNNLIDDIRDLARKELQIHMANDILLDCWDRLSIPCKRNGIEVIDDDCSSESESLKDYLLKNYLIDENGHRRT